MSGLKNALAASEVTREQVVAARLAQKEASIALAAARQKQRTGDVSAEKCEHLAHSLRVAAADCRRVEDAYDAPRKAFLRANRDECKAASEKLALTMQQIGELQRGIALDSISLVEAEAFQALADAALAEESDAIAKEFLTTSVAASAGKLDSLRREQASKQKELAALKKSLPRLQARLDELIGELAV